MILTTAKLHNQTEKLHKQIPPEVCVSISSCVFPPLCRSEILWSWVRLCQSKGVPCNDRFKLSAVLGEAVKVRQWNIWGLPKDDFSTDNAITVDQGRRWPLCIDPQVSVWVAEPYVMRHAKA